MDFPNSKRTQDKFYLNEDRRNETKEYFQLDISEIENKIGKFDAIFMLGVHSIFDDLNWLDSISTF